MKDCVNKTNIVDSFKSTRDQPSLFTMGLVHTYTDIFLIYNFLGFRLHVSGYSGIRIQNFLNPLPRVEILEWAMNQESCAR